MLMPLFTGSWGGGHDGVPRCSRAQYAVATVKATHSAERGHVWVTLHKASLPLHPLSSLLGSYVVNVRVRQAGGGGPGLD